MSATPNLDRHAIVYFGNDWFAENRTSSHHLARRLGARFRLLYVEVPGLRTPSAQRRDLTKIWRKLASYGGVTIPCSVIIPAIREAGVTSKAGSFRAPR